MEGWENALSYFTLDIFIIRNFQICGKDRSGCFLGKYLGNVLATEQAGSGCVGVGEHTCLCCPALYFSFLCGTILKVMCAFPVAYFFLINQSRTEPPSLLQGEAPALGFVTVSLFPFVSLGL